MFLKKRFPLVALMLASWMLLPAPAQSQTQEPVPDNVSASISIRVMEMAKRQAAQPPPPRPEALSLGLKNPKKAKIPLGPGYYQHLQEARSAWQERSKFNQYATE